MATVISSGSDLLTREEAAQYLGGLKPQTLACWQTTKRYEIPIVKCGSRVRYRRSDLDRFLESRTIGGAAE
jgi:excisionase family DNA binding protein